MENKKSLNKISRGNALPIIVFALLFIVIVAIFRILQPGFLDTSSINSILRKLASISLAATGLTFVIIVAKFDMSFHLIGCFAGISFTWLMVNMGLHPVIAVVLTVVFGGIWGALAGFLVSRIKFPDVITTIAIGSIAFGFGYLYSNAAYIYLHNDIEKALVYQKILGIPLSIWIMFVLLAVSYWIMEKTKVGRLFYSVGANPKASYLSGVSVNKIIMIAFILCGGFVSFTGMFMNAEQGFGAVNTTLSILPQAYSAVFIGWAIFKRPCIHGSLMGAALTVIITLGMAQLNLPYFWGNLVTAAILVVALLISKIKYKDRTAMIPRGKGEMAK